MTAEQIDTLEAGPEIDRLVSEACRITGEIRRHQWPQYESGEGFYRDDQNGTYPWKPSADWNDAMWAAERAGLFCTRGNDIYGGTDNEMALLQFIPGGEWIIYPLRAKVIDEHWYRETGRPIGCSKSGPLAICKAILKLKHAT